MTDIFLYPSAVAEHDIILRDPTIAAAVSPPADVGGGSGAWSGVTTRYGLCGPCPIHPPGVCRRLQRRDGTCYCVPVAPVAKTLLLDLRLRYGTIEGNKVYLAMQDNAQGPFGPGMKYDVAERGVPKPKDPSPPGPSRASSGGRRRGDEA